MTALKEFDRLEATGLWRAAPQEQRREVIVSLGEATLTISDTKGTALAHWSLAATLRSNGNALPAIYHPDGDPGETLEIDGDETAMIDGIDKLLRVIERRRPHPGKLRLVLALGIAGLMAAAAILWLPDALKGYTTQIVPPVKRAQIGQALLTRITRLTGQPCLAPDARLPLQRLSERVLGPERRQSVVVVPDGVRPSAHLPGGIIVLGRAVIEDHEDPDVPAGFILAENLRAEARDPLAALLDDAGLVASLRLLTTGSLPAQAIDSYAETLLSQGRPARVPDVDLLAAFDAADLRSTPYARALDITGESVLTLIEADPHAGSGSREVLSDADWVRLQGICGP
jgi:hypothetical protein